MHDSPPALQAPAHLHRGTRCRDGPRNPPGAWPSATVDLSTAMAIADRGRGGGGTRHTLEVAGATEPADQSGHVDGHVLD
jgi:hypothetical protein